MKDESGDGMTGKRSKRDSDNESAPVSNRALVIFFAALAAALVLGYVLLNKLADISREEDCALAHRHNCGAVEVPSRP